MREVLASVREFCGKVARHWYAVGVGVIGGVLGIISGVSAAAAKPKTTPFSVPLWIWLPLLACGFLVAITWAFHDVRMERDAAKDEVKRRFEALRYALGFAGIESHAELAGAGTVNVEIGFTLTNSSGEYLRFEFDEAMAVIEGEQPAEGAPVFTNGGVLPPNGSAQQLCQPVRGASVAWQAGSLKFTVRYGHPSAPLRYQRSQEHKLRMRRAVGQSPGEGQVWAELMSDTGVEDVVDGLLRIVTP